MCSSTYLMPSGAAMMLIAVTSLAPALGQVVRGGDQRSAGGEHRVDEEALAAGQVLGQTVRVRHLLGGVLLVALHAQEADFSSRNQAGHAVEHAQASAQHRHDDRARGGELLAGHRGDRRLDRRGHHGQVCGWPRRPQASRVRRRARGRWRRGCSCRAARWSLCSTSG